jgi:hypothetical protein
VTGLADRLRGRWRRVALVCAVVVLVVPLAVAEAAHLLSYRHVAMGFHADLISRDCRAWPSGTERCYSLRAVNLTPFPLPLRRCLFPNDTGPDPVHRFGIEKWSERERRWLPSATLGAWPPCSGDYREPGWEVLWPGASRWYFDGARSYHLNLSSGDRFRAVAFGLYDEADDWWLQLRAASSDTVATDGTANR